MARDFWQTWKPVVETRKINKTITIPAFSHACGQERSSIYLTAISTDVLRSVSSITLSSTQLTVDFYAKLIHNNTFGTTDYDVMRLENVGGFGLFLTIADDHSITRATIITASNTYTVDLPFVHYSEWVRYTISWSSVLNSASFYINGVLVGSVTTVGNMTTNTYDLIFGDNPAVGRAVMYLDEFRLYTLYRDAETILNSASYRGAAETGLNHYYKFSEITAGLVVEPYVGSIDLDAGFATYAISTTEFAPIKYGASFVAAEYIVDSGLLGTSLKYPIEKPSDDCNFSLVVRWVDNDGETQRRKFWDIEGVDIAPAPTMYNGERIPEDFVFEIWNVDGEPIVDLSDDLIIYVSRTSAPTTAVDHTSLVLDAPEEDTTLAEPFPLTPFPLEFNTQQTY